MSRYRVLSVADVRVLPPLTWLVTGIIPAKSFGVIYGPRGCGKSFAAIDLAHSIGLGNHWMGHRVKQGGVMYVAAGEGTSGLRSRVKAWELFNETEIENVNYGLHAVQLHEARSVEDFLKSVRPLDLSLVIFDTLARCSSGIDENTVQDMGKVVSACDEIREQTGAAVLLVHHSGKPDSEGRTHMRGSSALDGAVDTMIEAAYFKERREHGLFCEKQKEGKDFFPMRFRLQTVLLPRNEFGEREESAVPVLM